jgi:hypothetical protein
MIAVLGMAIISCENKENWNNNAGINAIQISQTPINQWKITSVRVLSNNKAYYTIRTTGNQASLDHSFNFVDTIGAFNAGEEIYFCKK